MAYLSLTLAGCVGGDDAALEEDFRSLHAAVYEVYDVGVDRDAVHGLLAASFAGEALTREYVEHFTTLTRLEDAEMRVAVLGVEYDDVMVVGRGEGSVEVEAAWTVRGMVHHPTHTHERLNYYRATFTVAETAEGLRIIETRMQNARRLASPPPEVVE